MPDLIEPSLPQDSRTVIAISERLARVEEQQRSTKEDMGVVRSTLHAINNEIQKLVLGEQTCASYLSRIAEATKDLPALASVCAAFNEMRPELRAMIIEREQRLGLGEFWKKFAVITTGVAALLGVLAGIGAGLVWLSQHLRPL